MSKLTKLLEMPRVRRAGLVLLAVLAIAWVIAHVMAIYTEAINWDELALFNRTEQTRVSGILDGGGRPGLAVVVLLPFVSRCTETIASIMSMRLLWAAVTVALLAGLFVFLLRAVREGPSRLQAAILGTASLALVPVFMRWSLQVRTDQPAVAAALWGGVFALSSRTRPRLAIVAGALIAFGYLFSQKAAYVGALVTVVALGDLFRDASFSWRRELARTGYAVAGVATVLGAYHVLASLLSTAPPLTVSGIFNAFANYRKLFGFRFYRSVLPSLYPQLVLLFGIAIATIHAYRRATEHRRTTLMALAVVALGIVIGWFHAAAFPYFWCTLGLFPATAVALGWPGLAAMLRDFASPVFLAVFGWLVWSSIPYGRELRMDTQAIQRRSYDFIEHDLSRRRGFSPDGGLFCRHDPEPLPQYFREAAEALGTGSDAEQRQLALIDEFKRRPIAYILDTFLLEPFPEKIREFWARHYVRYAATVSVAGQDLTGPAGAQGEFDVIVPGEYRWHGDTPILVAGTTVAPSATITLPAGRVPITLLQPTRPAALCLALPGTPGDKKRAFHSVIQIIEIVGGRTSW